jgi:hypothetical protein
MRLSMRYKQKETKALDFCQKMKVFVPSGKKYDTPKISIGFYLSKKLTFLYITTKDP